MKINSKYDGFVCEVMNRANNMKVAEFRDLIKSLRSKRKVNFTQAVQTEAYLTARGVEYDPAFGWVNVQTPTVREVSLAMKKIAKGKNLLRLAPSEE